MEQKIKRTISSYFFSKSVALLSVITIGISMSIVAFMSATNSENEKAIILFEKEAEERIANIDEHINNAILQIDSLAAFYKASYEVERSEFHKFAAHSLAHFPAIQALEWIPRVSHSKRFHVEKTAQSEGFPNFHITERKDQGVMIKAGRRDEYFPVYFVEPYESNEAALGFDLASDDLRLNTLIKSRDSGEKTATPGIHLVQAKPEQLGFLIFQPIYRKGSQTDSIETRRRNLEGFVLGVYKIGDLMEKSLADSEPAGIDVYLYDYTTKVENQFLYFHSSRLGTMNESAKLSVSEIENNLHFSGTLTVADRKWKVLCAVTPEFLATVGTWQPYGILSTGLFITLLISGYVFHLFVQRDRARQYATETLDSKKVLEHEISERREAEEAVKESEEKYRSLIENANDAIFIADSETGIIIDANKQAESLIGRPVSEIRGIHQTQLHPAEDAENYGKIFQQYAETGGKTTVSLYVLHKNGRKIPVEISASVVEIRGRKLIQGIFRDISERRQAEEALRESEEKYLKLFNNEIDAICIFDVETRKLLDVNEAYLKLYGYSREEALQLTTDDISAEPEQTREAIKNSAATGSMFIPLRRHKKKDGTVFYVELSVGPFTWKGRKVMYAVARDVTERIQLDNERLKLQKLESVGMLAGGIAHDFNNLLTGIFGNLSLAKMHSQAGSRTHQFLEETEKALNMTQNLTKQLLTFSKGGMPAKKTILLSPIVKKSVTFALSGSNVKSEFSIDEDLKPIDADEGQIIQVLQNIIINADQAMPDGGILKIRAENMTVGARDISPLKEGNYIALSIEDTGIGIPEEHLSRIFDPFFTSKHKGSGLGLATAYSIISKHDGLIQVKSQLGEGTTFYIYLPVSENELTDIVTGDENVQAGEGRILLMDDEEVVIQVCSEILRALKYTVDFVTNGDEAIEYYSKALESGSTYDAVILDLTIPGGMGGKETIKKLLEIDHEVKAIVSSGYSDDPIIADHTMYGFKASLTKPYNVESLSTVLHKVINGTDNVR